MSNFLSAGQALRFASASPILTSIFDPWGEESKTGRAKRSRNGSISKVIISPSAGSASAMVNAP